MNKLISIIIPFFNGEYLREAINSVLKQTYTNYEIIIINDGSLAKYQEELKNLTNSNIKIINQTNQGVSVARDNGIKNAKGDYILFLDADDLLMPNALKVLSSNISDNDIIFGGWDDFDYNGNTINSKKTELIDNDPIATYFNFLPTISTALIKKNNIQWDAGLKVWEVTQYFLENIIHKKVKYVPKVVTRIRQHNNPNRISIKYDHFNNIKTATFFINCKTQLKDINLLSKNTVIQIDKILLSHCYEMLKKKEDNNKCKKILQSIDLSLLKQYPEYKKTNIYGFVKLFSGFNGLNLFYILNKALNRI